MMLTGNDMYKVLADGTSERCLMLLQVRGMHKRNSYNTRDLAYVFSHTCVVTA